MASQQLQYRIGDIAQRKVTTQDPPRSGLVLQMAIIIPDKIPKSRFSVVNFLQRIHTESKAPDRFGLWSGEYCGVTSFPITIIIDIFT